MKTAEEILRECVTHEFDIRNDDYEKGRIIDAMKQYATEVAKEALKNASENAKCSFNREKIIDSDVESQAIVQSIDKQSILDENNIPKL